MSEMGMEEIVRIMRESGALDKLDINEDDVRAGHRRVREVLPAMELAYAAGQARGMSELIEQIMRDMPQEWEASEGSPESVVMEYVRALEERLEALGGHRRPHDGDAHEALGAFYKEARKHVVTDDVDTWNDTVDAWNTFVRIEADAE